MREPLQKPRQIERSLGRFAFVSVRFSAHHIVALPIAPSHQLYWRIARTRKLKRRDGERADGFLSQELRARQRAGRDSHSTVLRAGSRLRDAAFAKQTLTKPPRPFARNDRTCYSRYCSVFCGEVGAGLVFEGAGRLRPAPFLHPR